MPIFSPSQVGLNPGTSPYTNGQSNAVKAQPWLGNKTGSWSGNKASAPSTPQSTVLGAQTVRASGEGPFDAAYRQNLATYSGGQFNRPGGSLSFNPTAGFGQPGSLGGLGGPTGAGNAPVMGAPTDLLSMALGGGGFSATPPPQPTTPSTPTSQQPIWRQPDWQQWLRGLTNQGGLLRGY